jgi:hypothetical protein
MIIKENGHLLPPNPHDLGQAFIFLGITQVWVRIVILCAWDLELRAALCVCLLLLLKIHI